MSWLEIAAITFGLLGFAAMGAVLAFRIYRNPFLLAGLLPILWAHVKPVLFKYLALLFARMDEEDEKEMQREFRAGRHGEWLKNRWHKRKGRG